MYRVGIDIKPGKYKLSSIEDGKGNYYIDDEDPTLILPNDDEIKSTCKLNLKKGQVLYINMQKFELKSAK